MGGPGCWRWMLGGQQARGRGAEAAADRLGVWGSARPPGGRVRAASQTVSLRFQDTEEARADDEGFLSVNTSPGGAAWRLGCPWRRRGRRGPPASGSPASFSRRWRSRTVRGRSQPGMSPPRTSRPRICSPESSGPPVLGACTTTEGPWRHVPRGHGDGAPLRGSRGSMCCGRPSWSRGFRGGRHPRWCCRIPRRGAATAPCWCRSPAGTPQ